MGESGPTSAAAQFARKLLQTPRWPRPSDRKAPQPFAHRSVLLWGSGRLPFWGNGLKSTTNGRATFGIGRTRVHCSDSECGAGVDFGCHDASPVGAMGRCVLGYKARTFDDSFQKMFRGTAAEAATTDSLKLRSPTLRRAGLWPDSPRLLQDYWTMGFTCRHWPISATLGRVQLRWAGTLATLGPR